MPPETQRGEKGESGAIRFEEAHAYLAGQALPFWSTLGAYPNGCFVECLDLAGRPLDPGFTRVRVQARQIYVFSHAQVAGVFEAADLGARATEFFLRAAWLGPERGFAKLIRRDGTLIDATSDLYDIAFALFALAWRYRVAPEPRLLAIAHATLDFLDREMAHPAGGFHNDAARSLPRLQNPHMHLAEAMNAWFEASGERRFLARAGALIDLLEARFCDSASGALGEAFNEDWTPAEGALGNVVEPGHQFEWAWIAAQYGRLCGAPRHALTMRLIGFALAHGFDAATGLTIDGVGRDGAPLAKGHRLWPQTEALKAHLAAAELLQQPAPARIAKILAAILDRFLKPGPVPGTWIDRFGPDGSRQADKVPATSLYHVTLAFLEVRRLREVVGRQLGHNQANGGSQPFEPKPDDFR